MHAQERVCRVQLTIKQVSPYGTYFISFLPKLLLLSLPLSAAGAVLNAQARNLLIPAVTFIALISFIGHKEWRFIVYVVPIFNVVASCGASWM